MRRGSPGACVQWDATQRSGICHILKGKLSLFALTHTLGEACLYEISLGLSSKKKKERKTQPGPGWVRSTSNRQGGVSLLPPPGACFIPGPAASLKLKTHLYSSGVSPSSPVPSAGPQEPGNSGVWLPRPAPNPSESFRALDPQSTDSGH